MIDKRQRSIQSVEVGGALLAALAEADCSLGLTDLARRAGLPAAKAHPYLVSFGNIGLVVQDRSTGRYDFGPLALSMGLASLRRLDPLQVAISGLADLVTETGQSAAIAVWGNHGATVVHLQESTRPLHVNLRVGSVMSVLNTATGQVFAAYLPDEVIHDQLRREGMDGSPTLGAGADHGPTLEAARRAVRSHGLARTVSYPIPGVSAFSAPVLDHRGALQLAITLLGAAPGFDSDWQGPLASALRVYALDVTRRLGGRDGSLGR